MHFVSRPPRHRLLHGLVDRVWWTADQPTIKRRVEWVLPTCRPQIIVAPGSALFVGPKVTAEQIERRTGAPMVGVSFVAGAAASFIGAGGNETGGMTLPLDAVMTLGSLPDRLGAKRGEDALDAIEAEMASRLSTVPADPLVIAAERAIRNGHSAVGAVAALGVDRRTFVPRFREAVGVAPKHYERICRFNRTVKEVRRPDAPSLATIANDQGFSDQAHLTRELRHFALTSPARLHRDGATMINHVEADKIFKTPTGEREKLA